MRCTTVLKFLAHSILAISLIVTPISFACGQDAAQPQQMSSADIDQLQARIEASTELTPEQKESASNSVQAARDALKASAEFQAAQKKFQSDAENVQQQRMQLEREIKEIEGQSLPPLPVEVTELQKELAQRETERASKAAELLKVENQVEDQTNRQKLLKERLAAIPAQIEEIETQLSQLATSTEDPLLIESKRVSLRLTREKLQNEDTAIQAEQAAISANDAEKIPSLTRNKLTIELNRVRERIDRLKQNLALQQKEDAKSRSDAAKAAEERAIFDPVKTIYQQNYQYAEDEKKIRSSTSNYSRDVTDIIRMREEIEDNWAQLRRSESRLGASRLFGLRLQKIKRELAQQTKLKDDSASRAAEYEEAQFNYFTVRERRQDLSNISKVAEEYTISPQELGDEAESDDFHKAVSDALTQQQDYVDELINAYDDYIATMESLDFEQKTATQLIERYLKYINERVLWIRSHEPLTYSSVTEDLKNLTRMLNPTAWSDVSSFFHADFQRVPLVYFVATLIWLALLFTQKAQRQALKGTSEKASSRLNTALRPTHRGILWTFIRSVIFPLPIFFISWRILVSLTPESVHSLGIYLLRVATAWLVVEFVRQCCRPMGLGPKHFGWPEKSCKLIVSQLTLFICIAAPLGVSIALLQSRREPGELDAFERLATIGINLFVMYLLHHTTSRSTGVYSEWINKHRGSLLERTSGIIHLVFVAIPALLAILSITGYEYAEQVISFKLSITLLVSFCGIFLWSYITRWLTLSQRRIAIEQAREMRLAMQQEGENKSNIPQASSDRSQLAELGAQTRRLLSTTLIIVGSLLLWWTWSDVLPALQFFDNWKIPTLDISVLSIGGALLILALTVTAVRNIPGLVEILLLERLALDRSMRYAIANLTRYAIVLAGLIFAGDAVNLTWESLQWMAAALTFGLGFGLQEIFANFVSGIIILFEQPVRLGDVVTIDGVTGVVNRIQIRSTTLTDWDRKEYIVPNKEFITGRLLNWTLHDSINRLVLNVGVAYGSDPKTVREILLKVVEDSEFVLSDPVPLVTMEGFGDSSLDFVIRAYLPNLETRLETVHMLHQEIYAALNEQGIEIPFPQRDVHLFEAKD